MLQVDVRSITILCGTETLIQMMTVFGYEPSGVVPFDGNIQTPLVIYLWTLWETTYLPSIDISLPNRVYSKETQKLQGSSQLQ